jgi:hypothetical protein
VNDTDRVIPIRVNAEFVEVADNQERRVFQRDCVLLKLGKRGAKVATATLILPPKMPALPDIGPPLRTRGLRSTALEAITLSSRIGVSRGGLAKQMTKVDEVFLSSRALL